MPLEHQWNEIYQLKDMIVCLSSIYNENHERHKIVDYSYLFRLSGALIIENVAWSFIVR